MAPQNGGRHDHEVAGHGSRTDADVEPVSYGIGSVALRNHDQKIKIAVAARPPLDGRAEQDDAQGMCQRHNTIHDLSDTPLKVGLVHGGNVARRVRKTKTIRQFPAFFVTQRTLVRLVSLCGHVPEPTAVTLRAAHIPQAPATYL